MSKSYPQMPPEMQSNTATGVPPPAPPSYAQAIGTPGWVHSQQPTAGAGPPPQAGYPGMQYGNLGGGVPPPGLYQTQAGAPPVVIIQQQAILPLGPEPAFVTCPACNVQKMTRIEYEPSSRTHLMAALLCILGLWCCVCLPYCAGSCMNVNHYCGNCNKFLGAYGSSL